MLKNSWNRYLQSYELLPLFGLPANGHLPPEGFGPVKVQGTWFKCEPAKSPVYRPNGRIVNVSKARIFYMCSCHKWIPAGRAGQHMKGRLHRKEAQ